MPHALDGPQPDNRPPAYGCGHSFGMLGPSRIVVEWLDIWEGQEHLALFVCAHDSDVHDSGGTISQWYGELADGSNVNFELSILDLPEATWHLQAEVNRVAPAGTGRAILDVVNFVWGFAPIVLEASPFGGWAARVHRIGEWQTVMERFPAVTFPDIY